MIVGLRVNVGLWVSGLMKDCGFLRLHRIVDLRGYIGLGVQGQKCLSYSLLPSLPPFL